MTKAPLVRAQSVAYIVLPSWATYVFCWEELAWILEDPLARRREHFVLEPRSYAHFWPQPHPFELIPGTFGNGIVSFALLDETERWLGCIFLGHDADLDQALAMKGRLPYLHVTYLEPRGSANWWFDYDEKANDLRHHGRPKVYICRVTPEHVESDTEHVYWMIEYRKSNRRLKGLDELPQWAEGFGLKATRLPDVPSSIRDETADWFDNVAGKHDFAWFQVEGGGDDLGRQYAMLVYLAYHLRYIGGSRVDWCCLVANMEPKYNIRVTWSHPRRPPPQEPVVE